MKNPGLLDVDLQTLGVASRHATTKPPRLHYLSQNLSFEQTLLMSLETLHAHMNGMAVRIFHENDKCVKVR